MLHDHGGLLLVDERARFQDEIFGVRPVLGEAGDVDAAQNGRDGLSGELGVLRQLSDEIVFDS